MSKKILIGSQALRHWRSDFPRNPQDTDYLSEEIISGGKPIKFPSYKLILEKYSDCDIAPPILLYTLKLSHVYFGRIWYNKTLNDLTWMQKEGLNEIDEEIYPFLYEDWARHYGKKKAKLKNVKNEDFFTKHVKRKYPHDALHECVKFYDRPMYSKIKKDQTKAMVSKKLFDKLEYHDKIKVCLEEIYAVALERFLIPRDFCMNPRMACSGAIKLLLTSMSKGWFPKFIAHNIWQIKGCLDNEFVEKFHKNIEKAQKSIFSIELIK